MKHFAKRFLPLLSLLLVAACLLSSCGYRSNPSKFVSLEENDYLGLTSKVDREVITADDVAKLLVEIRASHKTTLKGADGKEIGKQTSGKISQFDEVDFHVIAVDKDGNIVSTSLLYAKDSSTSAKDVVAQKLLVGYDSYEKDSLLQKLESMLYGDELSTDLSLHLLTLPRVEKKPNTSSGSSSSGSSSSTGTKAEYVVNKDTVLPEGAFYFVTFSSSYTDGSETKAGDKYTDATMPTLIPTFLYTDVKTTIGASNPTEAIALGLQKFTDNGTALKANAAALTINIYPVGTTITAEDEADAVHINYNYDFNDDKKFDTGKIVVAIRDAAFMHYDDSEQSDFKATPLVLEKYTYPEDATGNYTVFNTDGTTKSQKIAGTEVTCYFYLTGRTSYELPEYNATFILDTEKFSSKDYQKTDIKTMSDEDVTKLKAEYEEHLRKEEQDHADKVALENLKATLANQVLKNAEAIKYPNSMIKRYVNDYISAYRYEYYNSYRNSSSYDKKKDPGVKEYCIAAFNKEFNSDEGAKSVGTWDEMKDQLELQAKAMAKQNMVTYALAEKLDVELTKEEYKKRLAEEFKEWEAAYGQIYALYYGITVTEDLYIENMGGKSVLEGAYLLDLCCEKLVEVNKDSAGYKDVYTDGTAVEKN